MLPCLCDLPPSPFPSFPATPQINKRLNPQLHSQHETPNLLNSNILSATKKRQEQKNLADSIKHPTLKTTHNHGRPMPDPSCLPSPRPLHSPPALRFIHPAIPALPPRAPASPRSHANSLSGQPHQPSSHADSAGAAGQRHGRPQSLLAGFEGASGGEGEV